VSTVSPWRFVGLGFVAMAMLLPVTLPVPVLRDFVQQRFGVGDFLASTFMAANMVGSILGAPLGGMVADRFGHSRIRLAIVLFVDAALLLSLTAPLPFPVFLGLRCCEGFVHTLGLSLLMAAAADAAPPGRRGRVLGLIGAGLTLGVALGAPLGGWLGDRGTLLPVQVAAAVMAFAAILAGMLGVEPSRIGERAGPAAILRAITADRALRVPLAFAFVDRFTVGFFTTTFPLGMRAVHDLPASRIGLLLALFLLPFSLLSYPFGRLAERRSRVALVAYGSIAYGIVTISVGFWPVAWLPLPMLLLGITSAVMFVPSLVLTNDLTKDATRGTAIGAFNAAGSLGFLVGPLVGGAVYQPVSARSNAADGVAAAFVVAGVAEILCVVVTLRALRALVAARRTT
jgi:MFS family permease